MLKKILAFISLCCLFPCVVFATTTIEGYNFNINDSIGNVDGYDSFALINWSSPSIFSLKLFNNSDFNGVNKGLLNDEYRIDTNHLNKQLDFSSSLALACYMKYNSLNVSGLLSSISFNGYPSYSGSGTIITNNQQLYDECTELEQDVRTEFPICDSYDFVSYTMTDGTSVLSICLNPEYDSVLKKFRSDYSVNFYFSNSSDSLSFVSTGSVGSLFKIDDSLDGTPIENVEHIDHSSVVVNDFNGTPIFFPDFKLHFTYDVSPRDFSRLMGSVWTGLGNIKMTVLGVELNGKALLLGPFFILVAIALLNKLFGFSLDMGSFGVGVANNAMDSHWAKFDAEKRQAEQARYKAERAALLDKREKAIIERSAQIMAQHSNHSNSHK